MRPKSLFLIVIALGCGLVASIGISQVLERRSEGSSGETKKVYVAMLDINTGNPLTADMVKLEDWPQGSVPQGAITNLEDLIDHWPRTPLVAGEVILAAKLIDGDSPYSASDTIPKGMRVSAVKVAVGDSPTGLVLPGDRVDVLCFFRASHDIPEATTKTILRNVTVFAVNEQTSRESDRDQTVINAKTFALLLTPDQDRILMLASELGKLRISLRRVGDDIEDESDEMTLSRLFERVAPAAASAPPVQQHEEPLVDFIGKHEQDLPISTAWHTQVITPGGVVDYVWEDQQSLPTSSSATALGIGNPLEAALHSGAADLETDSDLDQVDELLEQNELDIE